MHKQKGQITTVLTLIAMGVITIGIGAATWLTQSPSSPFYSAARTKQNNFDINIPEEVEVCQETTNTYQIANIRNKPEMGDPQPAKNLRLWLTPKDYINDKTAVGTVEPKFISILDYGMENAQPITVTFYPINPGSEKEIYFWADAAFAGSHHDLSLIHI